MVPGVSAQIDKFVKKCSTCVKLAHPVKEPMIISKLPKHPWERIVTDLLALNMDLSEVIKLNSTTSTSVITTSYEVSVFPAQHSSDNHH